MSVTRKTGEVDWVIPERTGKFEEAKKLPFFIMEAKKSYKMRVISPKPQLYWHHFVDKDGKMVKVNCSLNEDCPVVEDGEPCKGQKCKKKYYFLVIDRANGEVKVLDAGTQIVKAIGEFHQNEDYGLITGYDITIKRGAKGDNPLYTVMPSPKKPLTGPELELIAKVTDPASPDYIDIESKAKPMTAETIRKILGIGEIDLSPTTSEKPTTKKSEKPAAKKNSSPPPSEDGEEDVINWNDDD